MMRTIGLASAILLAAATAGTAQSASETPIAPVPFGVGEKLEYRVRLGGVALGNGSMEIADLVDVRGWPTYHIRFLISGGLPLLRVNNRLESWLDVGKLLSRRFEQDQREVRFRRHRVFDFYPDDLSWQMVDKLKENPPPQFGPLATDLPLDDVSFLYFVRTVPLEVGRSYTYDRYFRESGNPVVLNVLRKERVEVPAGTFDTVVVQPIIQTSGLFGDGGRAEVYFTDDERRLLVLMKSSVPVVGSLSLHLERYTPGEPLTQTELQQRAAR